MEMQGKEFQAPADLRNRPNGLLASLSAGKHKPPAELKNAPGRPLISRYHPELSGGRREHTVNRACHWIFAGDSENSQ